MSITTRSPRKINFASHTTDETVGPGSYETNTDSINLKTDNGIPFLSTTAREHPVADWRPGPGQYNPEIPQLEIHGGGSTMRSVTGRKFFDIYDVPAPCEYSQISDWSEEKSKGMRRMRCPMSSRTPRQIFTDKAQGEQSPADYDLHPPIEATASEFGKDTRFKSLANSVPGPGAYFSQSKQNKMLPNSVFVSASAREVFPKSEQADQVGLGHNTWSTPKGFAPFSTKQKKKSMWILNRNPSPDTYKITRLGEEMRTKQPSFGSTAHRDIYTITNNPSPAEYDIKGKIKPVKEKEDSPFLQRSPRFPYHEPDYNVPPGAYELGVGDQINRMKLLDQQSPSFKCSIDRNPYKVKTGVPGPADYTPAKSLVLTDHKLKRCMDSINRSPEGTFIGQKLLTTPSPDSYSPTQVEKKPGQMNGYMPHSPRMKFTRDTCAPSPDTYNLRTELVKPSLNVTYSTSSK